MLRSKVTSSITTPGEAMRQTQATALSKGTSIDFDIDFSDPTNSLDGVASFYQVFSIDASGGDRITLRTLSPVRSTRVHFTVSPCLFIMDANGNVRVDAMTEGKVDQSMIGRLRFEGTYTMIAPKAGHYYALAISDNRILDETIASRNTALAAGTVLPPWRHDLRAHSTDPMTMGMEYPARGVPDRIRHPPLFTRNSWLTRVDLWFDGCQGQSAQFIGGRMRSLVRRRFRGIWNLEVKALPHAHWAMQRCIAIPLVDGSPL